MTSACRLALALLFATLASLSVAAAPAKPPKPLLAQIQRLGELLRDSHAVLYPEATQVQFVSPRKGEEMALTVFTVEGFGGGNSHVQYLAAFSTETSDQGKPHYTLIDVVQIAGKGWRGIPTLAARLAPGPARGETLIMLDALEVTADDAPNFPSKKITVTLSLKGGRLTELASPAPRQ